jgi:hypothetical protein
MKILLISFILFFPFKDSHCQQKPLIKNTSSKEWVDKNCYVLVNTPWKLVADTVAISILPKMGLIPEKKIASLRLPTKPYHHVHQLHHS